MTETNKPSKEAMEAMHQIEGELFWGGYFTESQLERGARLLDAHAAKARLEALEDAAKIAEDEYLLDQHNEGHPEFFAKYGCVDVDDAIRKLAVREQAVQQERKP